MNPLHFRKRRHACKLPHYHIESVLPSGTNPVITAYLRGQGIWPVARTHFSEIYYYVEDEKNERKYFFAAGHQNELGAWQVKTPCFEGSLGYKALTIKECGGNHVHVFETYFDYASCLMERELNGTVLIVNDACLLGAVIAKARQFTAIHTYFHRGMGLKNDFHKVYPHAKDQSILYLTYNSYHEKITANLTPAKPGIFQHAFSGT